MDDKGRREFRDMVEAYRQRGDPSGWCENVYRAAEGDVTAVFWADLTPNPWLVSWLAARPAADGALRAVTIGCGLGDDAEYLSAHGYRVSAFDISPTAISMCLKRFPDSTVDYLVADLFAHPPAWNQGFDLVFECNTIQILPDDFRRRALSAIAAMVAPGGVCLVSCRSRNPGEMLDQIPLPLDREELDGFVRAGLREEGFAAYDDDQVPPVPHFFAWYRRPRDQGG